MDAAEGDYTAAGVINQLRHLSSWLPTFQAESQPFNYQSDHLLQVHVSPSSGTEAKA